MTRPKMLPTMRAVAALGIVFCVSAVLAAQNPRKYCAEDCGGGCFIATDCDSCDEGDPNDCTIYWNSNDQECYDWFHCHWSCPSCDVF